MPDKLRRLLTLIFMGVGILISRTGTTQEYDLPIRMIARADIHQLRYNQYSVRECLDIYNDDNVITLVVTGVNADTWRGHQKHVLNEDWFKNRRAIEIAPGKKIRVVERKRVVIGQYRRDWWVRWIRFNVKTNRGEFNSNFVASPFKRPGQLQSEFSQPSIDTLSEPQGLTPAQIRSMEKR